MSVLQEKKTKNSHHELTSLPFLINSGITDGQAYEDFVILFMESGSLATPAISYESYCGY